MYDRTVQTHNLFPIDSYSPQLQGPLSAILLDFRLLVALNFVTASDLLLLLLVLSE